MAKKRIEYQETYNKGTTLNKEEVLRLTNLPDSTITIIKAGRYEDGKEFLTLTIDNI